jgi:hypothetical protein
MLFYTKTKRLQDLKPDHVKKMCKVKNIKIGKCDTKESLCVDLGRKLFEDEVVRINNNDRVKYNNLKLKSDS